MPQTTLEEYSGAPMPAFEHLAGALRLLRDRRGLTQRQLAEAIASPVKQVSAYETGRQRPRIETLDRILAAVGADAMDLADAMAVLERLETGGELGAGRAAAGRSEGPSAEAAELSPELRDLAPRLPAIENLANDVLIELLSEAVERQARRLSDQLHTERPVPRTPGGRQEDGC